MLKSVRKGKRHQAIDKAMKNCSPIYQLAPMLMVILAFPNILSGVEMTQCEKTSGTGRNASLFHRCILSALRKTEEIKANGLYILNLVASS